MTAKNHKAFEPADRNEWARNAVVGGHWSDDWVYAGGFKQGADILVQAALDQHLLDPLFYPVCFLYRHAGEVTLKELIRDTERLIRVSIKIGEIHANEWVSSDKVEESLINEHRLLPLLTRLQQRLTFVSEEDLPDEVTAVIRELHELDPKGQSFRYARSRSGKGTTLSFPNQTLYDIGRIGDQLGKALAYLADGVGGWLDATWDNAKDFLDDMEQKLRSEY